MISEVAYCSTRAEHYLKLAADSTDSKLRSAYEAVALEFSVRATVADPNRRRRLVDWVAPEV